MLAWSGAESRSTGAPSEIQLTLPCLMSTGSAGGLSSPTSQDHALKAACHMPGLQHLGHAAHGCGRHHRRHLGQVALWGLVLTCLPCRLTSQAVCVELQTFPHFAPESLELQAFVNSCPRRLNSSPGEIRTSWVVTLLPCNGSSGSRQGFRTAHALSQAPWEA